MATRLPSLLRPPIAFAHRGARAHAPENTLEAFHLALRLGATGLESDVWLTADGHAVLDHGGTVGGRMRRTPIARHERSRLPDHLTTLPELYRACGTDFHLSVDIKGRSRSTRSWPRPPTPEAKRSTGCGCAIPIWLCSPVARPLAGAAARPLDPVGAAQPRHRAPWRRAGRDRDPGGEPALQGLDGRPHRPLPPLRSAGLRLGPPVRAGAGGDARRRASTPSSATTSTSWWRRWTPSPEP